MRAIHISFLEIPFQSIFSQKKINKILNFFLKVSMLKPRNCYPYGRRPNFVHKGS